MKKILFFVTYFIVSFGFSQGTTCATADPFCSGDQALIFPNTVGQPNSNQIACLFTQPDATWFYLQVENPGVLVFNIIQNTAFDAAGNPIGTPLDVDFVAWGPFSPNDDFCTMIDMGDCPTCPNNTSNPTFYPFGNIIDCSYDSAPVETLTINNAVANQVYAILITNYDGDPGFIKLVQTNSTSPTSGTTNCNIVCGVDLGSDQFYCSTTITSHTLTATFNQAPSIPGTPSYSWFLDGALQATTTTNSLTVNQSGVWSVEVVRPGCSDVATDSVEIRFSSEPVLNAPPSTIDIGCGPFDLTSLIPALVAPESPADFVVYFYTDQLDCWDGNANYIPNPTVFAPTVNTDIFIRVENVGNPLCNNSDQFLTLIYNCNPLASISSSSSVCEGSTATVTFTSDPGNVITYTVDGGPDQTVTIDATGQYVLTTPPLSADSVYTIISVFDGVTTTTLTGVSTTISVIPLPTVTISGTADICLGTSMDLTFTGTPDATVTYTDGTTNFTTILTGGVATVTVTPTATTTYSLVDIATNTTPVCNASPAPSGSAVITVSTQVTGSLSYSPSDFCTIDGATYSPTVTITGGGTGLCPSATPFYSATPAGLSIDSVTGVITPSTSTPGTYTVTLTYPACGGCASIDFTTTVTISSPGTASVSYTTPLCTSDLATYSPTLTGAASATNYIATPVGLTIDVATGVITPSTSLPGTYTINYLPSFVGACVITGTPTTVTITDTPTASISYAATPYCNDNATAQAVTLTGTNNYTGGVFSAAPATGLILDATTGAITPSGSTPGTYTISYAIPANGGCIPAPVTTTVTITPLPTASISYAASPYCDDNASAQTVTLTGTGAYTGGTYSVLPATGLILDTTTGAITPSGSTPGTYTVTYAIPVSGGCMPAPVSTTVTITAAPTASISYAATPYCNDNATAQAVTLTGTNNYTGGVFSAAPATGLILDATTGAITPSGSTPGTYTVSYAIPANGGCTPAPVTTTVTITPLPTAIINYVGSPYCETITTSQAIGLTGTGAYTGGTYSVLPATGLILDTATGAITPSGSTPGTYTVSYAIPASGGCTPAPVSTTVTITSAPTASFTVESPICSGATSLITITGTPNAVVTYAIDGVTQPTVTLDNTGQLQFDSSVLTNSVVYNLVGVDLGCYTDLSGQPSQSITVLSLPTAAVSANATCEGTTGIVTFTGTPNATVSYTFDGSPVQTIFLGPTGSQNLMTPVLTSNSVYTIESISFTTGTLTCVQNIGTSATVIVNPIPDVIATPNTQTVCSGTATSINLSSSVSGTTFSWVVTSQTNVTGATNGSGAVISNVLTTLTGGNGTVEYTVTPISNGCSGTPILVQVDVTPRPTLSYTVTNSVCDGATLDFVLNSNLPNTTYNWSASVSNISGSYLTTTSGDETNINQIATLTNSENVGTISMIIVPRANGCDGVASDPIVITVNPIPVIESVTVADNSVCSATNGTNNVHVDIVGNVSGITYTWTAITNGVTIVGGVTTGTVTASSTTLALDFQVVTSDPLASGTILFEVAAVRNGCTGNILQSEVITVNPIPGTPIPLADKTICSGEGTDLMIDVSPIIAGTELEWQVLSAVNVTGAQAGTGIAPQAINDILTSAQGGYVIYRVRTRLGDCEGGYTDYRVDVTPLPVPVIADGNICITASGEVFQTYTLNTGLSDTDYDFEWFDTNGTIIAGVTSATLVVDEAGTYSVIATNVLTGCSSDPTLASATAVVTATIPATAMTVVQSEYFSEDATITVNVADGTGTLLYQLDEGAIQSSNVFTNVTAGPHVVKVFDAEGCTYIEESIFVIDYPKFFTPNGDGYNDTWNITGLNQTNAKLYIFDRYGKLVKELSATDASEGWDGTYNQEDLPSTDYWFTLDYDENGTKKQFKAHFSLKR